MSDDVRPSTPVSVVTGANSGIGRAIALHLAEHGHEVYGTVRSFDKAAKLTDLAATAGTTVNLVEVDVADDDSVAAGMTEVLERAGRVDHLVNNAGVGGNGVVEECTPSEFLQAMNVNVCGAVRCIQALLPQMRERGSGSIVNITSIIGRFAGPAQGPYVASKWAFEGLSEELALEVAGFGVRVAIIEPGVTKSAIFAKNVERPNATGAYDRWNDRMFQFYAAGSANATPAVEVAKIVLEAVTTDEPRLRWPVSWSADELLSGRARMSDADWTALGATETNDDYYAAFEHYFRLDIAP